MMLIAGLVSACLQFSSSSKTSSIPLGKSFAILNASGRLGSYLPVSSAFTVCRETWSRSARSPCDHWRSARSTRSWFFIVSVVPAAGDHHADHPQRDHPGPDERAPVDVG